MFEQLNLWFLVIILGLMVLGTAGLLAVRRRLSPGTLSRAEAAGDPYTTKEDERAPTR